MRTIVKQPNSNHSSKKLRKIWKQLDEYIADLKIGQDPRGTFSKPLPPDALYQVGAYDTRQYVAEYLQKMVDGIKRELEIGEVSHD